MSNLPDSRPRGITPHVERIGWRPGPRTHDLFDAVRVGGWDLPNRIVMAPMTRSRATVNGTPSEHAPLYYGQRAGAGLIIGEAAAVSGQGLGYPHACGIFTEDQIAAWRKVATAVHARGGHIVLQLWHAGRITHPSILPSGQLPGAPSAIAARTTVFTLDGRLPAATPRALEAAEIQAIVAQFGAAARAACVAGFDGVDIHAANGYLIDQFLRDGSNQRTDAYGGSVQNRTRLLLEILEAVTTVWDPAAIGVRLSPLEPGNDMADSDPFRLFRHVVSTINPLGLGYLHVVEPGPGHPRATPQGRDLISEIRRGFGGALIVDGGVNRTSAAAAMLASGADLAAFATPFIANPDLVERLDHGWPLESPDGGTIYGGDRHGYVDYPAYRETPSRRTGNGTAST